MFRLSSKKETQFDFKKPLEKTLILQNKNLSKFLGHTLFKIFGLTMSISFLSWFFKTNGVSIEQQINFIQQATFSQTLFCTHLLFSGVALIKLLLDTSIDGEVLGNKTPLLTILKRGLTTLLFIPMFTSSINKGHISIAADFSAKVIQSVQHFF